MRRAILLGLLLIALMLPLAAAGAGAGAPALNPSNPLAKPGPWRYSAVATRANPELLNYRAETNAARKAQLGKIALTPRARWFANCDSCNVDTVRRSVTAYVEDAQRGDSNALVQIAIFGLWPDGQVVRGKRPAISWSMARYQAWIRQIAAGIGTARVAIVLEPDLAISANHGDDGRVMPDPTPGTRMKMTAWAAKYLSTVLRRESIYIDAGSADWLYLDEAVRLLRASGIQYARGFALGATHYDSVASNVAFAAQLSTALSRIGIRGKRAVIDTADNGTPFTWLQWNARWGPLFRKTGNQYYQFDNTPTCGSRTERVCQTIGHRPTWNPVDSEATKLGLGTTSRRCAAKHSSSSTATCGSAEAGAGCSRAATTAGPRVAPCGWRHTPGSATERSRRSRRLRSNRHETTRQVPGEDGSAHVRVTVVGRR